MGLKYKYFKIAVIILGLTSLFIGLICYLPRFRANIIMPIVSRYELYNASPEIKLNISVDKEMGWFPHMLIYGDKGGFNRKTGLDADLTIYYSFGDFKGWGHTAHSTFYEISSEFYSAFYGGYVIEHIGNDISEDVETLSLIPAYDYQYLILNDLGLEEGALKFDVQLLKSEDKRVIAGEDGWHYYNMKIETLGSSHSPSGFIRHDLQFGSAPQTIYDFPEVTLYGEVYTKYFEVYDTEVMLYVISPDQSLNENTVSRLLNDTSIDFSN